MLNELDKETAFFIYLLEQYAACKNTSADRVLQQWDAVGVSDFFCDMYERYHSEDLQNAFDDIDRKLSEVSTAKVCEPEPPATSG